MGRLFKYLDVICSTLEAHGPQRFGEIQRFLGIPPSVLARNLAKLQEDGRIGWEYVRSQRLHAAKPYRRYVLSRAYYASRARDLLIGSIDINSPLKLKLTKAEESVLVFASEDISKWDDDVRRIEEHEYSQPRRIVEQAVHLRLAKELRRGTRWNSGLEEYTAWKATNEKLAQSYANLAWLGYLSGRRPVKPTPSAESFYERATEDYVSRDYKVRAFPEEFDEMKFGMPKKEPNVRCLADVLFSLNEPEGDRAMAFTEPKMSLLADWFEAGLDYLHYKPYAYATASQRRMVLDAILSFPFDQHMGWSGFHEASATQREVVQLLTGKLERVLENERFLTEVSPGSKLPKWKSYVGLLYRAARPIELIYVWAPALPLEERYKLFLESELVEGLTGFHQWLEDAKRGMYDWDTKMLSVRTEKKLTEFVQWLGNQPEGGVKPLRESFANIAFSSAPYCQTRFLYEHHPDGKNKRLYEEILMMIKRRRILRNPKEWAPPRRGPKH